MINIIKLLTSTVLSTHLHISIASICSFIEYLKNSNDLESKNLGVDYILNEIKSMDLELKIQMLMLIFHKSEKHEEITSLEQLYMKNLEELVNDIDSITKKIKNTIEDHKLKWFYTWRSFDVSKELEELKRLNMILSDRITLGSQLKIF
jgi:hypothetical protein